MDFTPEDEIATLQKQIAELEGNLEDALKKIDELEEEKSEFYDALQEIYSLAKHQL